MSILVNKDTRVIVQGITGREGRAHAAQMQSYGTQVVAGVTPGKTGQSVDGIPVFDSIRAAQETLTKPADWTVGFVPANFARAAAVEALEAGLNTIVITEHVPVHDTLFVHELAQAKGLRAIGPNCPGIITPGQAKLGIMPGDVFTAGNVGVVSRSGTLTYEIVSHLSKSGIGQSSCVGIGGDPVNLTNLEEALRDFEADPQTKQIVLIGEIGGTAEEYAARELIGSIITKPVVAFLAGRTAPRGKTLGHAGAIITGAAGTVASKEKALRQAGVPVARMPKEVAELVKRLS